MDTVAETEPEGVTVGDEDVVTLGEGVAEVDIDTVGVTVTEPEGDTVGEPEPVVDTVGDVVT